jgi:hypothetical protein
MNIMATLKPFNLEEDKDARKKWFR